ncbi:hypothetical protein ACFQO7_34120 [Catellatospora aurea]|uniref:Uncharacterized protein n=1 Tax=Catellatospora aurea TaxID=1337874 RepID=A0ABW2H6C6_9ACTN
MSSLWIQRNAALRLLAVPVLVALGQLALTAGVMTVLSTLEIAGTAQATVATGVVVAVPLAVLTWVLSRRMDARAAESFGWLVPSAVALGASAVWVIPDLILSRRPYTDALLDTLPATAAWGFGMVVLLRAAAPHVSGPHSVRHRAATAAGAFLVLELSTAVDVLTSLSAQQAPHGFALLWYPSALSGLGAGGPLDPAVTLHNAVGAKAVLLTICTVFVLGLATARARRSEAAATAR